MSDGTPEAVADTGLGDPSMEDILASIRRIIADDAPAADDPAVARNEEDTVDIRTLAVEPAAQKDQNETLVEAATPELIEAVDFDDILIMDDDAFSVDDLDIPETDMFSSDTAAEPDLQLQSDVDAALDLDDVTDVSDLDEDLFNMIESLDEESPVDEVSSDASAIATSFPDGDVLSADDMALIDLLDAGESDDLDILPLETVIAQPTEDLSIEVVSETSEPSDLEPSVLALDEDFDLLLDMDLTANEVVETVEPLTAEPAIEMTTEDETFGVLDIVESSLAELNIDETLTEPQPLTAQEELSDSVEVEEAVLVAESLASPEQDSGSVSDDLISIEDQHDDVVDLVESLLGENVNENVDIEGTVETGFAIEPHNIEDVAPVSDDSFAALLDDEDDIASDVDIDLVKSLMADLTDEALMTDDTEEPGIEDITAEESDILDDILELTMNDEAKISETEIDELVAIPAVEIEQVVDDSVEITAFDEDIVQAASADDIADPAIQSVDSSINALLQIAAAAETDAREHTNEPDLSVLDYKTTLIAEPIADTPVLPDENDVIAVQEADEGVTDFADQPLAIESINFDLPDTIEETSADAAEDDGVPDQDVQALGSSESYAVETVDVDASDDTTPTEIFPSQTDTDPAPQETEDMPQLVAKDGILDGVAEAASAEAFASLNTIVEEKTVFEESGPRIGDLVQEALRPMLKEWLDDNLKAIVERAVAKEVKRIASGK